LINYACTEKHSEFLNTKLFKSAVQATLLSQDILVGKAQYPTTKIGENANNYRQLGLGYANLGALLMCLGHPYDSDSGRSVAAAITSLITSTAYNFSSELARLKAPFKNWEANAEATQRVVAKHFRAHKKILSEPSIEALLEEGLDSWAQVVKASKKTGFRNCQVSVIAPTGCVVSGTRITTDKGLVKVETLGSTQGEKWQDINAWVATDIGPQVATKFFMNGVKPTRKIITDLGFEIEATLNHRVRVAGPGGYSWKFMADIAKNDILVLLRDTNITAGNAVLKSSNYIELHRHIPGTSPTPVRVPSHMTEDLAYFLGFYMGNGNTKNDRVLRFSIGKKRYEAQRSYLENIIKTSFGLSDFKDVRFKSGAYTCNIYNKDLIEFLRYNYMLKDKSPNAFIPEKVLQSTPAVLVGFIRGLFDSEGSVSRTGVSLSMTSEALINDLQVSLLSLGIVSRKVTYTNRVHSLGKRPLYKLSIAKKEELKIFRSVIGFRDADRIVKLNTICDNFGQSNKSFSHKESWYWKLLADSGGSIYNGTKENRKILTQDALNLYPNNAVFSPVKSIQDGFGLTWDLSVPNGNTYQAGGFVSHNTIGYMMDCATSGLEPELSLRKTKKMVGGGIFSTSNPMVDQALINLNYTDAERADVHQYINDKGYVEGCPTIKQEHIAVFDCSFLANTRFIAPMGHVRMMAAVQPFITGAISKTINAPSSITVEEICNIYMEAWKLGLKSITVYRDGSKASQPLSTNKKAETVAPVEAQGIVRRDMPDESATIRHKFNIGGHKGYLHVGQFEDGQPGELFIRMAKAGSTINGLMDNFGIAVSLGLQYGVPIEAFIEKYKDTKFDPQGWTGNQDIRFAKSLLDYIFRWVDLKFVQKTTAMPEPKIATVVSKEETLRDEISEDVDSAGIPCVHCGHITVPNGSCHKCPSCGATTGCS
jgi:ribonucleoside-diphosphate reductase alpha chain